MKRVHLLAVIAGCVALFGAITVARAHEHEDADDMITVKGEVLDLACYLGHGGQGAKHADCAKTCKIGRAHV